MVALLLPPPFLIQPQSSQVKNDSPRAVSARADLDIDSESEAETLVGAGFLNPDEPGFSSQEASPSKRSLSKASSEETLPLPQKKSLKQAASQ